MIRLSDSQNRRNEWSGLMGVGHATVGPGNFIPGPTFALRADRRGAHKLIAEVEVRQSNPLFLNL